MTVNPVTYKKFDDVLAHLGFSRQRAREKWLRYEHQASDLVIILVEKRPNYLVRVTDIASAWRHLVEKGLVSEPELDELLSQVSVTNKTAAKKKVNQS